MVMRINQRLIVRIGFFLGLVSSNLAAQYHPLLGNETKWQVRHFAFGWPSPNLTDYNTVGTISAIGQTYFSIKNQYNQGPYLRDDTIGHKVMAYFSLTQQEYTYMDFSAQPGDTLLMPTHWRSYYNGMPILDSVVVHSVDTLRDPIDTTLCRRVVKVSDCGWETYFWIEGVGSTRGFSGIIWCHATDSNKELEYVWNADSTLRYNFLDSFPLCNPPIPPHPPVGLFSKSETELILTPNPASDKIIISGFEKTPNQILLMDEKGRVVLDRSFLESKEELLELNIVGIPPGLYFVQLISSNQVLRKKLMVTK